MSQQTLTSHPWIAALEVGLDGLEKALLDGDAAAVERASAHVQAVLNKAPKAAALGQGEGFTPLRNDLMQAAQRFAMLRQAVLRGAAQSERAVNSLIPGRAPATYGRLAGQASSTGGAGRGYLSA